MILWSCLLVCVRAVRVRACVFVRHDQRQREALAKQEQLSAELETANNKTAALEADLAVAQQTADAAVKEAADAKARAAELEAAAEQLTQEAAAKVKIDQSPPAAGVASNAVACHAMPCHITFV